ncbi:MAG: ATP-binding protein [Planctomycetota bacterium]
MENDHQTEPHFQQTKMRLNLCFIRWVRIVSEFKPNEIKRSDRPEYPLMALREGLMNALTHRDYASFDSGMSVSVYPDRIEIWNSGGLPEGMTIRKLKRHHPSLPRNPDISHMFYLRGLIERIGRGTIKIIEECRAAKLPAPSWVVDDLGVTLTIFGPQSVGSVNLNKRQIKLLTGLNQGDQVVPGEYYSSQADVVSQRQAQRDLSALEAGGWLRQKRDGPSTVYIRTRLPLP